MIQAEFYRRLHTGNPGDESFYERVCQGARRVLELGCGWGRVSLALAKKGHRVVGVDQNVQFIEWAREERCKNAEFIHADIVELPEEFLAAHLDSFDRIVLPYNTAFALGGRENFVDCLRAALRCLTPEGELWLDVYDMDEVHFALIEGEQIPEDDGEPVAIWKDSDGITEVFERTEFSTHQQLLEVEYEARRGGETRCRLHMRHHYFTREDLFLLLEEAGFSPICCLDQFPSVPAESKHLIVGAIPRQSDTR